MGQLYCARFFLTKKSSCPFSLPLAGVSAAFPKTGLARMAFFNDAGPLDVSDTAVGSVEFGKAPKGYPASGQQSRPGRGMDPIEEVL